MEEIEKQNEKLFASAGPCIVCGEASVQLGLCVDCLGKMRQWEKERAKKKCWVCGDDVKTMGMCQVHYKAQWDEMETREKRPKKRH